MSAIYSMRKQVTCPHCNVLLSGNTALAAHIAKGHLPSVPITSSTTPMAPLGCSNDSDGLKTHISTAFGGLLDRGLVNRLERGRGSCGSPRLGRPPTNRPQEQTALRPAPTSASAPPAARRPRPVYDTELAKQVMRELSSKRVGTTEGTARKSHLHHYACFYCHRWFKLQSTRKLHMVSAHLNVIMASKSKQAEPGHNPDRLSGSEDSDRECGTGSGELRGVPAHSRVEHGQLDFPRQGSWSGGVVSAIPTVTPDEEEATKRKALAALREMSARRRRGRGRGTARRGTRLPPAPSSRADRLAELEERSAFDLPPVETGQLRSPKREMEYVFVEEETPFLHKWEMPDGPDTAQDPLSIEQKIGALTDDPPMEGDPLSVCDPQIVKKEVLDDPLEVSGCNVCIKEDPDFNLEVDATDNKEAATEGPFSDITDTAILTPTGHLVFEAARTGQTVPDSSHPGGGHCEDSTASDTASSTGDTAALASADNGGIAESSDFNRVGEERRLDGTGDTTQPTCYVEIIAKAILRSPERRATLSEIYAFVTNHFPYFVCSKKGWHNAIASNLWFSKYFMKVAPVGSNGKYSNYWMLDPRYEDTFKNGNFCNHCRMLLSSYGGPGAKTALAELDGPAVVTCQPPDARLYRQRHGDLSARSQLPAVGEGWTLGPLALRAATVTTGGDDPVPPSHNLQCPSTAAPSSAGVSVSEVSGSAPDSPQRSSGHCVDDRPASDTVTLTGEPVTLTSPSGGIGSSGTATDSGATASDVAASGLDGEQHSTCAADTKPPFSYMELSAMAIVHSPHRRATLSEIYAYITSRFPYFKHNKKGWRNTIRGTLSLYECFVKVPRESGVGSSYYWTLDPQYEDMFENGKFRRRQRANWPFGSCPSAAVEVADHVRHRNRTNQPRQQQQHSGLSEHCQLPSTATGPRHGSQVLHTADATDTGDGGGGGGGGGGDHLSGTTDSHCASSAPLTTPSLSVSNVDGTGKDAANSLHTDSGHIEGYALALDETVSAGTAATSTSGTDGPTNSDGASTVINSGGTTASSAASGVGEEQHTGDTESASSVDKKPPFSYKALIAMAIAQSPHRKAKLSEIYAYITRRFPYFEHNKKVWQNSIRHNLSLHKCFVKVLQKGRKEKGNYWVLDPQFEGAFKDAKYCQRQCNNQPFHRDAGAVTNSAVPGGVSAADMHFARDEHSATTLTTPSLSVSSVNGTGKDAAKSFCTDDGNCEGYAPALDEMVSAGTAATSTSGSDSTANGDDTVTGINSGGTTASDAVTGVGEEQHTGNTDSDSTAEKRPPFSYKALIAMAIAQSPHRKAKLSEIYAYITRRFPYFKHSKKAWQNSIRHNLSLHKCFVKVLQKGRKEKGNYWVLDPQFEGTFKDAKYCQRPCNEQPFHRDAGVVTNSAVPGDVSVANLHFARDEHRSTEIPSFEESYLQNVSSGELVRNEEKSIHFISCSAPTRGIGLQLDNSFCSTAYMSMVDNIFSVFTCSSCLERFSSKYSLIMHVFVHIDCVQPPLHVCRYCGEVFLTYFGLNKHLWTEDDDGTLIALPFSDARGICHSSDLCSDVVSSEDHVPVSFDSVTGNSSNEQVTNTDLMKRADCTRRKDDRSSCIQAQQKDCYT